MSGEPVRCVQVNTGLLAAFPVFVVFVLRIEGR
jgi:hypothetical protein